MKKLTLEQFITKAKQVHNNKYDYSKVKYINAKTKVSIICALHGEFTQTAGDHLSNKGCPKCNGGIKFNKEQFIEKAKEKGIKVVTSMGDVAASGGYYIAANSNKIFAETNTITGSIGVFGMIPNTRELYEKHMGLTMDTVKTGRFSTMSSDGGMFFAFNEEEGKMITESIEEIYDIFKTRVSEGRSKAGVSLMNRSHVDTIAEGRV